MRNFLAMQYDRQEADDWKNFYTLQDSMDRLEEAKKESAAVWKSFLLLEHRMKLQQLGIWVNDTVWA